MHLLLLPTLLLTGGAEAKSLAGVSMADTAKVGGQPVTLNGMGLREKYFIDIYVGGLYLSHPTHDGATAIAADEPKEVLMHFIYKEVTRDQMIETFTEGFGAAINGPQAGNIAKMESWIPAAVKAGEEMTFTYVPGTGTSLLVNGRVAGTIPGAEFMKLVWGVYLGPKPPTADLKSGMLGG